MGGIYGLVFAITSLLNYYFGKQASKFECSINIGCNGQAALNNCFLFDKCLTSSHPNYDIIIAIRRLMHRYPRIQWKAHHIQGHQDSAKAYSELDLWEKLNVECDARAKSWWRHCVDSPNSTGYPPQISVQNAPWAVLIGDQLVTKDLKSVLRDYCSGKALKACWTK